MSARRYGPAEIYGILAASQTPIDTRRIADRLAEELVISVDRTKIRNSVRRFLDIMVAEGTVKRTGRKLFEAAYPGEGYAAAHARAAVILAVREAYAAGFGKTRVREMVIGAFPPSYARAHVRGATREEVAEWCEADPGEVPT